MRKKVINVSISILSLICTLLALEVAARSSMNEWGFYNFLELQRDLFRSAYPVDFDNELGWTPKQGNHQNKVWNTTVTILEDGIRSNGNTINPENKETILVVGDSFAFGDQVSDEETWPARLEELADTKVINGGVFGYGVDQTYLRMRSLASKYRPNIIIFGLIPTDIYRCELSVRTSAPKPYFDISDSGELVLMNKHLVPINSPSSLDYFRKVIGYSYVAHRSIFQAFPEYWLQGLGKTKRVHAKGTEIACRIFQQLKRYAGKERVKIYVLVQYEKDGFERQFGFLDEAIACIDQDVIEVVDLRSSLAEVKEHDINKYEGFFDGHMTREGNNFVASILWGTIGDRNKQAPASSFQ